VGAYICYREIRSVGFSCWLPHRFGSVPPAAFNSSIGGPHVLCVVKQRSYTRLRAISLLWIEPPKFLPNRHRGTARNSLNGVQQGSRENGKRRPGGRNPQSYRIWTHLSSFKASFTAAFVTAHMRAALLVPNRSSSLRILLSMVFMAAWRDFFQN